MANLGTILGKQSRATSDLQYQFGETDSITFPQNRKENITLDFANIFVDSVSNAGSSGIYDNPVYGIYGSSLYAGSVVGGFVLGNPTFGVLGTIPLGSCNVVNVRIDEKQVLCDWIETFDTDTYKDTGSTTGSWSTTGSLVLGSAEEAWSTSYTTDIELTNFTNIKFITYPKTGYSTGSVTPYMSTDNGSSWLQVDNEGTTTVLGSIYYGKRIKWKLINNTSDIIEIEEIRIRSEGENYITS